MWLEVKVIADVALTVGGITLGVIFVRKVCQIANSLAHMAGALYTIDTCVQPDTLRRVLDKALRGGPTFLEDQIAQYVTPEQRCPGLRKAAVEHGPEEDYPEDKDPQDDYDNEPVGGGCMADWAQGEKEAYEKMMGLEKIPGVPHPVSHMDPEDFAKQDARVREALAKAKLEKKARELLTGGEF
jgi:hypothetical protein